MKATPPAQAIQFFRTLEKTERLSLEKLQAYKFKLLSKAVAHARDHVEAQRDRLGPLIDGAGNLDLDLFCALAPMTKDGLRAGGQAWFAHDTPEQLKPLAWSTTSGTTAEPILIAKTKIAQMVSSVLNERQSAWHRFNLSSTHGIIRHFAKGKADYPEGIRGRGWSMFDPSGALLQVSVHTPVERLMTWIHNNEIRYLTTYPSVATGLAQQANGYALDAVLTFGEPLSQDQRHRITEAFSCPVIDAYTANETGFIAIDCPEAEGYHIQAETVYVELVDSKGSPVKPGERGSVLVTPFYNTVMPLIRYELGDHAEMLDGPCPCGRTLPRLRSIAGRGRQLFRFPDGSTRWPNINSGELTKIVPLSQFQVVQTALGTVEFRYVPRQPGDRFNEEAVTALIRRDLYPELIVHFVAVADVERTEAGKLERYISLITGS